MLGEGKDRVLARSPARLFAIAGLAVLAAVALYAIGFVVFVETLQLQPGKIDHPDAIVVLTGGDGRVGVGVKLLEDGIGKRLLISGVDPRTTKQELRRIVHGGKRFDCCADLGFSAANTHGNAAEAAAWTRAHGYRSLLVVTASYHMPRSLTEFSAEMPNVKFEPWPTQPRGVDIEDWWNNVRVFNILRGEYAKYLASVILTHFATETERDAIDPARERNRTAATSESRGS